MKQLIILLVLVISIGCIQSTENRVEPVTTAPESLDKSLPAYYTFRASNIRCFVPPCEDYYVERLNSDEVKPIIGFEFAEGLNKSIVLDSVDDNSVVVFGSFVNRKGKQYFSVQGYHKQMPNKFVKSTKGAKYYFLGLSGVQCVKSPCPSYTATLVNLPNQKITHFGIKETYSNISRFDSTWFSSRIYDREQGNKIIARGAIVNGYFELYTAFAHLPDPSTPCPQPASSSCPINQVKIFTRNADRCLVSAGCTPSGACTLSIPVCDAGYHLESFPGGKFGCPTYYCDFEYLTSIPLPTY